MSTVAKDNLFEESVYNIIQYLLKNDHLRLSPTQTKLFKKKPYLSKKGNSNIIVDISMEVWPPQAQKYSLLWVCEFKNYSRIVPLDDLEAFNAKLEQIAGKNIKGVIASSNALQQTALDYARVNGIGVIRILPNDQVRWVIDKSIIADSTEDKMNPREISIGLTSQNHTGNNHNLYAFYDGYLFDNMRGLLSRMLKT